MKFIAPLAAAAAILAAGLAAPAFAHGSALTHIHLPSGAVLWKGSRIPNMPFEIDPSILHPVERTPIPLPGPRCLSCPTSGMFDGRAIMPGAGGPAADAPRIERLELR